MQRQVDKKKSVVKPGNFAAVLEKLLVKLNTSNSSVLSKQFSKCEILCC
ncbi:hypothetical protein Ga0466249_001686 [Sporomusaceae bacterium BoRhaA]|nr:hypothetical protein [Pelorhabdus rhamnosifermentans]